MDQTSSKVSFPIGSKLLISIVLLLGIVIGFLSIFTVLLLNEDKRAYTYQTQSTETRLVGQEISSTTQKALDLLKAALASIDPYKKATPQQEGNLKNLILNQTNLIGVRLSLINTRSFAEAEVLSTFHNKILADLNIPADELEIPKNQLAAGANDLLQKGYALFNASKLGHPPLLAVVFADLTQLNHPSGVPMATGFVSLQGLGSDLTGSEMTITSSDGRILFDFNPDRQYSYVNLSQDPLFQNAQQTQVTTGATEFELDETDYLGSFFRPGFDLIVMTKVPWRTAMKATYSLLEKFLLIGVMAICLAVIFGLIFSNKLTHPILELYEATKKVASGHFDLKIKSESKDEIGALSESFNVMSEKIQHLIKDQIEKTKLEGELAIASTVQQTLIPPPKFDNEKISIRSYYEPASVCGGDWWGFFGVGNQLAIMIADATGHGLPSALITAAARSCFSVMHKLAQDDSGFSFSPGSMLSYANRVIFDAAQGQIMMTFFIGVVDFKEKTLTYANGAHNPPWLFSQKNNKFTSTSLVSKGKRLGEAREVPPFEEKTIPISNGDVLFLYTDGLIEGKDLSGTQFSKKKAKKILDETVKTGPEKIIQSLVGSFHEHSKGKNLDDDITLAAAKFFPEKIIEKQT